MDFIIESTALRHPIHDLIALLSPLSLPVSKLTVQRKYLARSRKIIYLLQAEEFTPNPVRQIFYFQVRAQKFMTDVNDHIADPWRS